MDEKALSLFHIITPLPNFSLFYCFIESSQIMLEQVNLNFLESEVEDPEKERILRSQIHKKSDGTGMFLNI